MTQDVTTKSYVDVRTPFGNEAIGTGTNGTRALNDILVWDRHAYDNATPRWRYRNFPYRNVATFSITADSIVNADVNTNAPIAQSKLAMNAPTTRANATGIAQSDLGLVAFDDGDFTVTDGWVTLD